MSGSPHAHIEAWFQDIMERGYSFIFSVNHSAWSQTILGPIEIVNYFQTLFIFLLK